MDLLSEIRTGGILYILLLIAITMHEYGHAIVADKLGDRLPRMDGRTTLNPIAHMDMLGTVILPILTIALTMRSGFPMVFGWGKPVRIMLDNPATRKRVDFLSTLGGVSMNLVLAGVSAALLAAFELAKLPDFAAVAALSIYVTCVLFVINMIPVPPLDGSVFLRRFTNISEETLAAVSRWGIVILLVLLNVPLTSKIIMSAVGYLAALFFAGASLAISIFK